jgi:predicted RNA binding protein YcfA (HicA-like mRNA interferase family)
MNRNYVKGARVERKALDQLEKDGYRVIRSAGSHSPFDIVAIGMGEVRLIQLKACKKFYQNILDSAIKEIRASPGPHSMSDKDLILPSNCVAEVWICEDRKGFAKYEIFKDTYRKIADI